YGVGAASALAFVRTGYDIAISATRAKNLDATLSKLSGLGGKVLPLVLDLRSPASIEEAARATLDAFGDIDALVTNAGITLRRLAVDVAPDEWNDMMTVNVTGTFLLTQHIGRHMIECRKGGAIVSIASTHALIGAPER